MFFPWIFHVSAIIFVTNVQRNHVKNHKEDPRQKSQGRHTSKITRKTHVKNHKEDTRQKSQGRHTWGSMKAEWCSNIKYMKNRGEAVLKLSSNHYATSFIPSMLLLETLFLSLWCYQHDLLISKFHDSRKRFLKIFACKLIVFIAS